MPPQQLANWKGQSKPIIVDIDALATGVVERYSYICASNPTGTALSNAYLTERQQNGATAEIRRDREGEIMPSPLGTIFTIEIDGKPTVTFEARQLREAAELCKEEWLRTDFDALSSNGVPLCRVGSKLRARIANELERATYQEAAQLTPLTGEMLFAYLVELDGAGRGPKR